MSDATPAAAAATPDESNATENTEAVAAEGEAIEAAEASTDELQDVAASADATPEEKKEAVQELKKRMKFKVNGKDVEREIDFNDEKSLQELLQKGFAADERFQSASSLEKKMREFAALLQQDPIEALIAAGHDPDKLTESYMKKRVDELAKSPEQLQLEKLQKEIEKERKLRETLENEKLTAEQAKVEAEYSRQLDEEISTALTKSELPKSPYVIKRIAENLMIAIEQGNEDVSVHDVLPVVEKQIREELQGMFEAMPEDVIEKVLGSSVADRLRKRRISKMKAAPEGASTVKATGQSEINKTKAKEAAPQKIKAKDFFKNY